jgi:GTP-binding protein Era
MNSGFVSIIGRPNVGKSTFLNNFLGEKIAAVSPKPQTTRNRIMGVHTEKRGQILFLDTPGIHKPYNKMHKKMVQLALAHTKGVELIMLVIDVHQAFGKGDEFVLEQISKSTIPIILVLNKIDLVRKEELLPLMKRYQEAIKLEAVVPISAINKQGFEALTNEIFAILPENEPLYPADTLTDQPERALAAEIVREKVFLNIQREVPFCSAVLIDAFVETDTRLEISASILLERKSQKGIVIGKGGSMLKKIGTEARRELMDIFGTRIHLELFVKVRENWREDERMLRELGL